MFRFVISKFYTIKCLLLEKLPAFSEILFWSFLSLILACIIGPVIALFLYLLHSATYFREEYQQAIYFLPFAGLSIGYVFNKWGKNIVEGNNLIIDSIHKQGKIIPFIMAPFIMLGTVITHLVGGSAGREGTAIQMGASIADQFTRVLSLDVRYRGTILICGISVGFGAVFGTPFAGAIFGLEVYHVGKVRYHAIFPALLSSIFADLVTKNLGIVHTQYNVDFVPQVSIASISSSIVAGICFGIAAILFIQLTHIISKNASTYIRNKTFIPFIGGTLLLLLFLIPGTENFQGLGISTIENSFNQQQSSFTFALKILFTTITLGFGLKGGEVTPLFFIGATLGSSLSFILPLPVGILAAMGFVAVFAGAANTPLACSVMGIELFGMEGIPFIAIACVTAYIISGHRGIYHSQIIGESKIRKTKTEKGKSLKQLH